MTPLTYEATTEVGNFTHVVEASDLGLGPGQWPHMIIYSRPESRNGELMLVEYRQALGCLTLRVFND